jgi:mono/diheme cytochrome c family protein
MLVLCALAFGRVQAQASGATSAADGVYSEEQANRGEETFLDVCANCHSNSEFRGENFAFKWEGQTVRDLYRLVRTTMPIDSPGRLSEQQYIEVIAYLLKLNRYPAGETALGTDETALRRIRIDAHARR